ncbi:hypothetical protein P175DRAFT_099637 [Aspergillus ochraceoroseus IBT 24754]|uniref:Uncharacterized protein n=1 Tax=Aspergillus ochraceoroseus IBT 24754 TaxID=1392256 RepID=A0A2T5LMY0_9EURO|nr:uncharacterized protein P175DRAFT_099637 [Aspergillus ochraceoroseus IBT 24754]PTU17627.1 hypothetical protein P175DRAFT_099637 [Aspergillus ochraceoroseus IBT 24754]
MKRDHSKVEGPFEEPSRTAPQADSAEASANPGPAPDVDLPRTPQRPIRRVRHLPERAARSRAVRRINQAASRNNPAQRIQPAQNTVPYLPGQDAIAGYQVVDANYATGYGNNVYHISQPLQLQYADVTPAEAYSMYPNQEANPPVQGGIVAAAMAQDPQPEQPPVHPVARDAALFQNYVNTLMEELDQGL